MAQDPSEMIQPGQTAEASAATTSSPTTTEIRLQIQDTRAEMSETINAIHERLSPSRLMAHAKETVGEATVGRVKSLTDRITGHTSGPGAESSPGIPGVPHSVKNKWVPAALIGLGATGILLRALKRPRT